MNKTRSVVMEQNNINKNNCIFQHIPNFIDGVDSQIIYFSTKEELLNIPFVKCFSYNGGFSHFALDKDRTLMAVYDDGFYWLVVGRRCF